jgi:hypothetical protein
MLKKSKKLADALSELSYNLGGYCPCGFIDGQDYEELEVGKACNNFIRAEQILNKLAAKVSPEEE